MRGVAWISGAVASLVSALAATPLAAQVVEPNGVLVPAEPYLMEASLQALFEERGEDIDVVAAASVEPATFWPHCEVAVTQVFRQSGKATGLAWYNVPNDATSAPAVVYPFLEQGTPLGTRIIVDVRGNVGYEQGKIGFVLTDENARLYYSEFQRNANCTQCVMPGHWKMTLVYSAPATTQTYYLAFEDWAGADEKEWYGNDGDFNDQVYFIEGIDPGCDPGPDCANDCEPGTGGTGGGGSAGTAGTSPAGGTPGGGNGGTTGAGGSAGETTSATGAGAASTNGGSAGSGTPGGASAGGTSSGSGAGANGASSGAAGEGAAGDSLGVDLGDALEGARTSAGFSSGDGGCACRAFRSPEPGRSAPAGALLALAVAFAMRRRSARREACGAPGSPASGAPDARVDHKSAPATRPHNVPATMLPLWPSSTAQSSSA